MSEYIVKETNYPLASGQEVVGELIRCKDCKHWFDIDDGRQKHRMCANVYGDWFCADAERRTDG